MRRASMAALAALALIVLLGALPARAQSLFGLSFRPTGAAPEGAPRGTADIIVSGTDYLVSVDLSQAARALDLADYEDAEAFVVWTVDMDGVSTNIGTLDDELRLEKVSIDYVVARLYVTAEASPDAPEATGERLYELQLRQVTEVARSAAEDDDEEAAEDEEAAQDEKAAPAVTPTPEPATSKAQTGATETKPQVLPTTGSDLGDLLVLLAVAAALILTGLRLRTVRL